MSLFKQDFDYGRCEELRILPIINKYYKCNATETKPYHTFDYKDKHKKIYFELKSRRVKKDDYYDTMIGINKIDEGLNKIKKGYRVVFIFNFSDHLCQYELKNNVPKEWIREGGRKDRGFNEMKKYMFIPVCELQKIKYKKYQH